MNEGSQAAKKVGVLRLLMVGATWPILGLPLWGASPSFTQDIQPILRDHCLECHNREESKGGFDVSSHASLFRQGRKAGPGVVPGHPERSSVMDFLEGRREPAMPKGGPALSERQVSLLREWIREGALPDEPAPSPAATGMLDEIQALEPLARTAEQEALLETLRSGKDPEASFLARRQLRFLLLPPAPAIPAAPGPVHNAIDHFIHLKWAQAGLPEASTPPPLSDDFTFVRRVYLDVLGAIPTMEEARRFLLDNRPNKRSLLIDELLSRDSDYADHWVTFWEDALASSSSNALGGIPTRGDYQQWLREQLGRNRPYDLMVAELLDPSLPGHRGRRLENVLGSRESIDFVRNSTHQDVLKTASDTAQVFLGTSMKCASCHSHFDNSEWPQARFIAFAGLFSPTDLELIRCERRTGEMIPAAFPFELKGMSSRPPKGLGSRLTFVARSITDPLNPRFAKAIVNRLWKRHLGHGLVEPADDFREEEPASHPALLEWLARDFMDHGFDLKHTLRLLLNSRTYQLQYRPEVSDSKDTPAPQRFFRSPALRPLTAEQTLDSLFVLREQQLVSARRAFRRTASSTLSRVLGRPVTRTEVATSRPDSSSVLQGLELLNGDELSALIYDGALARWAAARLRQANPIPFLFLATLSRTPSPAEQALANDFLASPLAPETGSPKEILLVEDELPANAITQDHQGTPLWQWIPQGHGPVYSGNRSHSLDPTSGQNQHSVNAIESGLEILGQETLLSHVWLDPQDPPSRIALQWRVEARIFQVYWSDNEWNDPLPTHVVRIQAGRLPPLGAWTRLEMPVQTWGVGRGRLLGWAYSQEGGRVYWDRTTMIRPHPDPTVTRMGDLLWALVCQPEFHYIR